MLLWEREGEREMYACMFFHKSDRQLPDGLMVLKPSVGVARSLYIIPQKSKERTSLNLLMR